MAAALNQHEMEVEKTDQSATVPSNDIAKLMYYIHCVCCTIDCNNDPEIQRFTQYSKWYNLSTDEQRQLVVLCYTFSPDMLDGKVFFQNDALCMGKPNEFYEISQVSNQLLVAQSVIIAGRTRQVNKIMTYKKYWMQNYYTEPMRRHAQHSGQDQQRSRSSLCAIL